ncbi:MAG: phosphodiester glycosidase family protein [Chloroflexota bacterium]
MHRERSGVIALIAALATLPLLAGCAEPVGDLAHPAAPTLPPSATATSSPTRTALPSTADSQPTATRRTPPPSATPSPSPSLPPPAWNTAAPGIGQRYVPVELPGSSAPAYLYALRFDPDAVTFRVHYDPAQPRTIEEWEAETGALAVFNGGFFSGNNRPVGRIIIDGELFGIPLYPTLYGDDSIGIPGIFTVIDGAVELYALGRSTYNPRGLRFDQAVESYPMLLLPGRQPAYPEDTGRAARRTVIALDEQGNVIVLLIDWSYFTLYGLSRWLAASDLSLYTAMNLDGGRSSGLGVNMPGEQIVIPAYVPLPIVIAVYPRGE